MTRTPEQILCCPEGCVGSACRAHDDETHTGYGACELRAWRSLSLPDRLTLARALLPDGWVVARDRDASAAHATRATDLWLVTEERDNLRAGTDRLIAERTILRARVETLEAALIARGGITSGVLPRLAPASTESAARAAMEGKP